jgi:hypothetical protein
VNVTTIRLIAVKRPSVRHLPRRRARTCGAGSHLIVDDKRTLSFMMIPHSGRDQTRFAAAAAGKGTLQIFGLILASLV